MSRYSVLKEAIQKKKSVFCHFGGTVRFVSPHTIGSKNGEKRVLVYQYAGKSRRGLEDPLHNWRCLPINKIRSISIITDKFYTAPNHTQVQNCVGKIEVNIRY